MKRLTLITMSIISTSLILLVGCVGYNTTVMMTKSNAGLDLDTKPPTLEANISRKEMVVAPSFEGGQTPPVMASFGSKSGSGGSLGRFFFGVNQTFAGGDTAMTLAKLYNSPDVPEEGNTSDGRFDSAFGISELPDANKAGVSSWRQKLFGLSRPGEVRPFVFGTDTQLGVKIGWTGTGSPVPETIKIGFNRKEMAVAPVMLTEDKDAVPAKRYKVKMPSFLATVDSDVKVSGDVSIATMQYFAIGGVADHLACQPGVRAAMLVRADPQQAVDFTRMKAAQARNEKRNGDVEEIIAGVTKAENGKSVVDKDKLTKIANGVDGLDEDWLKLFAGASQPIDKLRADLRTIDRDSVPALHANLSKLAQ